MSFSQNKKSNVKNHSEKQGTGRQFQTGRRGLGSQSTQNADCCLSQDVRKSLLSRFPETKIFCTINEAHKQYSLLDKIFNYVFCLGPPGTHL